MSRPEYIVIDREAFRTALRNQDLRHWWVAERLDVHITTLRRWLNGRSASMPKSKFLLLIEILEMDSIDLTTPYYLKEKKL